MKKWAWLLILPLATWSAIRFFSLRDFVVDAQISTSSIVSWYSATPPISCPYAVPVYIIANGYTGAGNLYGNTSTTTGTSCSQLGGGGGSGVSSFNTRTGAVTLTAADVNAVGAITNSTTGTAALASGLNSTALAVANTWTANQSISGASNVYLNLTQTNGSSTSWDVVANGREFILYDATNALIPLSIISDPADSYHSMEMATAEVFGWCNGLCSSTTPSLDTGFSRVSAAVTALGNGTAGNASGTLKVAAILPGIIYSAAGTALPTCTSGLNGQKAVVSDATIPTYLGAYTSGGAVVTSVLCNGSGWVTD